MTINKNHCGILYSHQKEWIIALPTGIRGVLWETKPKCRKNASKNDSIIKQWPNFLKYDIYVYVCIYRLVHDYMIMWTNMDYTQYTPFYIRLYNLIIRDGWMGIVVIVKGKGDK